MDKGQIIEIGTHQELLNKNLVNIKIYGIYKVN